MIMMITITANWLIYNFINLCFYRTAGVEVKRACDYLVRHQMADGGWGEDFSVRILNHYFL